MRRLLLTFVAPAALLMGIPGIASAACPSRSAVTVTTADELRANLEDPNFAGTIVIPSNAAIDLEGRRWMTVRSCVTIKGTRGGLDPGALLFTRIRNDHLDQFEPVFKVIGQTVRIEGLRFEGPLPTSDRNETQGTVGAILVTEGADDVVIQDNSFAYWNQGIRVDRPGLTRDQADRILVRRNYFNRNANERQGHGIGVHGGYVRIEGNLFNGNRHAVAATGSIEGGKGYIARYNYVLDLGFTECWPCSWNQHFDVHGSGTGGYGGTGGEYFDISRNTIRGEQIYGVWPEEKTRPAFMLRGRPTIGADFRDNVVIHDGPGEAVRLKKPGVQCCTANGGCSNERCNLHVGPNAYNTDTAGQLAVGDFDGDGRDDVFLANGTGWWYSSAGLTEWRFLRASDRLVADLRFGRFDADARTDVLFSDVASWWVSSGGTTQPRLLRGDATRLTDCVFGDFNRDGITDALRTDGSAWSVAAGGGSPWLKRLDSGVRAASLRVGDFTGDHADDVFWIENNTWTLWIPDTNVVRRDHRKPMEGASIESLVVADFDGDGLADLGQTDGNGWRWLRTGTSAWAPLRGSGGQDEYKEIRWALLGRFTTGRPLAAIRYASSRFPEGSKPGFVLWPGTGDAFAPWTPPWQEMY